MTTRTLPSVKARRGSAAPEAYTAPSWNMTTVPHEIRKSLTWPVFVFWNTRAATSWDAPLKHFFHLCIFTTSYTAAGRWGHGIHERDRLELCSKEIHGKCLNTIFMKGSYFEEFEYKNCLLCIQQMCIETELTFGNIWILICPSRNISSHPLLHFSLCFKTKPNQTKSTPVWFHKGLRYQLTSEGCQRPLWHHRDQWQAIWSFLTRRRDRPSSDKHHGGNDHTWAEI